MKGPGVVHQPLPSWMTPTDIPCRGILHVARRRPVDGCDPFVVDVFNLLVVPYGRVGGCEVRPVGGRFVAGTFEFPGKSVVQETELVRLGGVSDDFNRLVVVPISG